MASGPSYLPFVNPKFYERTRSFHPVTPAYCFWDSVSVRWKLTTQGAADQVLCTFVFYSFTIICGMWTELLTPSKNPTWTLLPATPLSSSSLFNILLFQLFSIIIFHCSFISMFISLSFFWSTIFEKSHPFIIFRGDRQPIFDSVDFFFLRIWF